MTNLRTDEIVYIRNLTKIGTNENKAIYSTRKWNSYRTFLQVKLPIFSTGVSRVSYLVCHMCLTWCVTCVLPGVPGILPGVPHCFARCVMCFLPAVSQVLPVKPSVQAQVKEEESPIHVPSLLHGSEKHWSERYYTSRYGLKLVTVSCHMSHNIESVR